MKRVVFYTTFVLAVVIIGAVVVWHSSKNMENSAVTNAPPTPASVAAPKRPASSAVPSEINASTDSVRISAEQATKAFQDKFGITSNMTPEEARQQVINWYLDKAKQMEEQDRHLIFFYGKTIDENNQSLAGVNVHFSLNGGLVVKDLSSVADGNFSISGLEGKRLVIDVAKDGYYTSKSNQISFDYTNYRPNPLQPEIFHLRKKGEGADLTSANLFKVEMPLDGTLVNVDLLNRTFGNNGQLQMSQTKPPYESWKRATEWSFRMSIPDGGFVEENDEFPFEAPANGYQPTIGFDFKADQPDWKTRFAKSYYIVFGNPPRYGNLTVQTDIIPYFPYTLHKPMLLTYNEAA